MANAIVVPLHVPVVIVPTVAKLDNDVKVLLEVAVIFPAVVAVLALPVTLPVNIPVNPVDVTELKPAIVVAVPPKAIAVEPIVTEVLDKAACFALNTS